MLIKAISEFSGQTGRHLRSVLHKELSFSSFPAFEAPYQAGLTTQSADPLRVYNLEKGEGGGEGWNKDNDDTKLQRQTELTSGVWCHMRDHTTL